MDPRLLDLVDAVFAVNGGLLRAGDAIGGAAGLTSAQWQVLGLLEHGPDTASSVARRRGLRRQSVQGTVDRLLARGLLLRRENPTDARAPLLEVTDAGRQALVALTSSRDTWLEGLGVALEGKDVEAALDVLRALRHQLGVPPRDTPHTTGGTT